MAVQLERPVRFPTAAQGNLLYPLPPDYARLPESDQRWARLNAVCLQETPDDWVTAWRVFRALYLEPEDSGWYDDFLPSPELHYRWTYDLAGHDRCAWAAPRETAKSTWAREMLIMSLLTRAPSRSLLVKAIEDFVKFDIRVIQQQLESNERILRDFGEQKPARGRGASTWTSTEIELLNGAALVGSAVGSAKRGFRVTRGGLLVIDDPEDDKTFRDPLGRTSAYVTRRESLMRDFEVLLFKQLLRACKRGGRLLWLGTLIDRRAFLWRITNGDDPRFRPPRWHTRIYTAEPAHGTSIWQAKWSWNDLKRMESELGDSNYASEMLNRPGSSQAAPFKLSPEANGYSLSDGYDTAAPLSVAGHADYSIVDRSADGGYACTAAQSPWQEVLRPMHRAVIVDYATAGATHDYSAVIVVGADRNNVWWVLDLWMGRVRSDPLIGIIWDAALRWRVRHVGVESVGLQSEFVSQVRDRGDRLAAGGAEVSPRVVPIKHVAGLSKEDRIGALEWRVRTGKLKLPWELRQQWPWSELFMELRDWTPDGKGLAHDDAIDALAMTSAILRGPAIRRDSALPRTPLDYILSGELLDPDGMPWAAHLSPEQQAAVGSLLVRRAGGDYDGPRRNDDPADDIRSLEIDASF